MTQPTASVLDQFDPATFTVVDARAGEPKRLLEVEGGHYSVYPWAGALVVGSSIASRRVAAAALTVRPAANAAAATTLIPANFSCLMRVFPSCESGGS
jgi:hypothetical protein